MKIIKNILIIIGAVLLLNYIVYLPMCVDDYIREESEVYSVQNAYRSSTLHNKAEHAAVFIRPATKQKRLYL